jgi:hypothetical protein
MAFVPQSHRWRVSASKLPSETVVEALLLLLDRRRVGIDNFRHLRANHANVRGLAKGIANVLSN